MDEVAALTTTPGEAAQLAVAVLDAEAEREAQQAASQEEVLFATDLLPGVGEDEVSLGRAVRIGGVSTFVVLCSCARWRSSSRRPCRCSRPTCATRSG